MRKKAQYSSNSVKLQSVQRSIVLVLSLPRAKPFNTDVCRRVVNNIVGNIIIVYVIHPIQVNHRPFVDWINSAQFADIFDR